jgi:hypothetical protein
MCMVVRYCTAEMVRAVPNDGRRCEVVYGELLMCLSIGSWIPSVAA